jgi:RNA polymerase sigma-70 factor, ECF subfamily
MDGTQQAAEGGVTGDVHLVGRALDGDAEAYEELYVRHRDRAGRAAYLVLGDAHLAQDVAQEAFLVGWRALGRLRDPAVFGAWVTGIALNLSRRPAVRRRLMERPLTELPAVAVRDGHHVAVMVRDAVASLPDRMRAVALLRFYGEYSEAEIAEALSIPPGTVKSRLSRARTALRRKLHALLEEA